MIIVNGRETVRVFNPDPYMTAVPVKVVPRCALAEDAIMPIVSVIMINK
jgi:hypothetical protein